MAPLCNPLPWSVSWPLGLASQGQETANTMDVTNEITVQKTVASVLLALLVWLLWGRGASWKEQRWLHINSEEGSEAFYPQALQELDLSAVTEEAGICPAEPWDDSFSSQYRDCSLLRDFKQRIQLSHAWIRELWNREMINMCCFSHRVLG